MFVEVELEWTVVVQPAVMKSGAHIQRGVILALLKDFKELKCTEQHGYYVAITTLEEIGEGRLWERRGCAAFPVRFRCIVFQLMSNEYVLAVVTQAQASGIICQCGPVEPLFIATKHLKDYEFSTFAESLDPSSTWTNKKKGTSIKKDDVVRVKIIATKWESAQRSISAVGSLADDYAGFDGRWAMPAGSPQQKGATEGWEDTANDGGAPGDWGEPLETEDDTGAWGN